MPPPRATWYVQQMIQVTIVDDDKVLREGIARLVNLEADMRCTQQHGTVAEALAAAPGTPPDVILLDIHMPGMLGSVGAGELKKKHPATSILMLSVYEEQDKVFESICNGACGYLLKRAPRARLIEAIRDASTGGAPMSPEIASKVLAAFRRLSAPATPHDLTPKEVELLALLADGHSYLNAAHNLDITINTVRKHVRSIYDKLQVHTKSEAVSKAMKHGILR